MKVKSILYILGAFLFFLGLAMIFPLAWALYYGEGDLKALALSMLITMVCGGILYFSFKPDEDITLSHREGFLIVATGWFFAAFFGANLNSYVLNKRWTFEDRSHWSKKEYLLFLCCSLGGLGINCLVLYFLSSGVFPETFSFFMHLNLAKLSASVASMVWNFYAYKVFVFSPRIGAEEGASGPCSERVKSALR